MKTNRMMTMAMVATLGLMICNWSSANSTNETTAERSETANEAPLHEITLPGGRKAMVSTREDERKLLANDYEKRKCRIEVNKKELRLYVIERTAIGLERVVAHYPVCIGLNFGDKKQEGDMRTPETNGKKKFKVTEIVNSAKWLHDFGDGRGRIAAYGNWFLRLETGHKGIGIHGSTNNEFTVPGRASEGCIRLRDADIKDLKERFAWTGMEVTVTSDFGNE